MTRIIQKGKVKFVIIKEEPDGICELCGKKDELRPYGPNDENICYNCAMKDEKTTDRKCREYMFGKKQSMGEN